MNRKQFYEVVNDSIISVMDEFTDELEDDLNGIVNELESLHAGGSIEPEDLESIIMDVKNIVNKVY